MEFKIGEELAALEPGHSLCGRVVTYVGRHRKAKRHDPGCDWRVIRYGPYQPERGDYGTEYMRVQHLMKWTEYELSCALKGNEPLRLYPDSM